MDHTFPYNVSVFIELFSEHVYSAPVNMMLDCLIFRNLEVKNISWI